jgi:predicted N-acetyltransferase YhbS
LTVEFGLAVPRDRPAVEAVLRSNHWDLDELGEGEIFVARDDGEVVGVVHGADVAPEAFYIAAVVVKEDRRGRGVGSELMRAVMAERPGRFFLACHDNRVAFYERLGYQLVEESDLPTEAREYAYRVADLPSRPDHVHHLMRRP